MSLLRVEFDNGKSFYASDQWIEDAGPDMAATYALYAARTMVGQSAGVVGEAQNWAGQELERRYFPFTSSVA